MPTRSSAPGTCFARSLNTFFRAGFISRGLRVSFPLAPPTCHQHGPDAVRRRSGAQGPVRRREEVEERRSVAPRHPPRKVVARPKPRDFESRLREQPRELPSVVRPIVWIARTHGFPREPAPEEHERIRKGVPNGEEEETSAPEDAAELAQSFPVGRDVMEGPEAHDTVERARAEGHPARVASDSARMAGLGVESDRVETEVSEGGDAPAGTAPDIEYPSAARQAKLPPRVLEEHSPSVILVLHPSLLQTAYAAFAAFRVRGRYTFSNRPGLTVSPPKRRLNSRGP